MGPGAGYRDDRYYRGWMHHSALIGGVIARLNHPPIRDAIDNRRVGL